MAGILRVDQANVDVIYAKTGGGSVYISGHTIQVQSTSKTDTYTGSVATTWTDVTGLSVNITPKFATSKILVMASIYGGCSINCQVRVARNGSGILVGDAAGSRPPSGAASFYDYNDGNIAKTYPIIGYDSPATTSTCTYKVQWYMTNTATVYFNRCRNDSDNTDTARGHSSITVMEIAQ